jgi:hypothetical protein
MGALPRVGASGVVDLLDQARGLAAQRFRTFGPDVANRPGLAPVAKAVSPFGPQIEPGRLVDAIMGGQRGLNQDALPVGRAVRNALGEDSPAWQQVQQAMLSRVLLGGEREQAQGLQAGKDAFEKPLNRVTDALEGSGAAATRELLGQAGVDRLSQIRDVLQSYQHAPYFVTGPSGAAAGRETSALRAAIAGGELGELPGTVLGTGLSAVGVPPWVAYPLGGAVGRAVGVKVGPALAARAGRAAALRAVAGYVPPPLPPPAGAILGPAVGTGLAAGIPAWLGGTDIPSYLGGPRRPRDMRSYLAGQ